MNIVRKTKGLSPVSDLDVRLVCVLATEWWVATETFKHDGTKTPPVTLLAIALTCKDLRSDVIWCSYGRVSHLTSIVPPHSKNPFPILWCHGKVDRIYGNRFTTSL